MTNDILNLKLKNSSQCADNYEVMKCYMFNCKGDNFKRIKCLTLISLNCILNGILSYHSWLMTIRRLCKKWNVMSLHMCFACFSLFDAFSVAVIFFCHEWWNKKINKCKLLPHVCQAIKTLIIVLIKVWFWSFNFRDNVCDSIITKRGKRSKKCVEYSPFDVSHGLVLLSSVVCR